MTTLNLHKGSKQPLHLSSGSVVAFKSTLFNLTKSSLWRSSFLNLDNKDGDTILRIFFHSGEKKIFWRDYTSKSLLDDWGKVREADLDVGPLQHRGATISVYSFLTDSRLTRYQILVNRTTVGYFDSRARGPVTKIYYGESTETSDPILSNPLKVICCAMLDLPPEEQRAFLSGM